MTETLHGIEGGVRPLVTVVIPTFRRHGFLELALRSVREQTHRPLQVIVVDDDDDPTTGAVVERAFAGGEGVETVFLRQPNLGAAAARNIGLAAARGLFVQFLDDDDELLPRKIAAQVDHLLTNEADVVYGDWTQGQDLASARVMTREAVNNHFAFLLAEGWVPPFAYLTRSDACRSVGGWRDGLEFNDDFDFFLRLAASGASFHHKPLLTGFYRWHPGPRVSSAARRRRIEANMRIIGEAERIRTESGGLSSVDLRALAAFWRGLATVAVSDPELFSACRSAVRRLRDEIGEQPGILERALGEPAYYALRSIGGPGRWMRRVAHRVLPLGARRRVRRAEKLLRDRFSGPPRGHAR